MYRNEEYLFVIPAYNEEKNIEKVIKEIKKDVPYADILIVNDCSKDNTKKICLFNNVNVVTNPFNLRYAHAVQTGLKYANFNNYDYVIQFDADGQHIAKYTNDLIEKMKKTKCDIVIGSRFLKKTDYPHPFFRKIGTWWFSKLIKLFCKKDIKDPTSGFQLINKKVIEEYSKIGNYPEFPDANLIMEMIYKGYQIEEVAVEMRPNSDGVSMHGGIIKPIKYMVKVTYSIFIITLQNLFRKGKK